MEETRNDNSFSDRQLATIQGENQKLLTLQMTSTQSPLYTFFSEREMTEHFTAPFRLLNLPQRPIAKVIQHVVGECQPPKQRRAVMVIVAKKTLAPTTPPTVLMQTCKHLADAARKVWLDTGVFHLYIASWTHVDENPRLLVDIAGTTDLSITVDIRGGVRSRIAGNLESPLRVSRICAQIRALVIAVNAAAKIKYLILRVVQGKHASAYVSDVAMNAFRELRITGRVHILVQVNEDEKEVNVEYGGHMKPELLGQGYLRQLVADIIGRQVGEIAVRTGKRRYKRGKMDVVIRRLAGGVSQGLREGFDFDVMVENAEMMKKMDEVYDWIEMNHGVALSSLGRGDEEAEL